jgi:translation initiation factor 2 alpha subunit (eIF-2alpha)
MMDCRLNVKFEKVGDEKALEAIRASLGRLVEIKEYDECIEVHCISEFVRGEVRKVRDHFREEGQNNG